MSRRGIIWRALLGALCLICFGWGRSLALGLENMPAPRVLSGLAVTGQRARDMLETESMQEAPMAFAAWGQLEGQQVQEPLLGLSATADVLLIAGPSGLVYKSDVPLDMEDDGGCLIDPATAQALFGNSRPVGSTLEWDGRTLTVRGVLGSSRPLLAVQALDRDSGLDHVSLLVPEGKSPGLATGEFSGRHGLFGSWAGTGIWAGLAGSASLLPVLLALGYGLIKIIKTALAAVQYPVVFLACLLAAGAVWMAGLLAAGISFQIPAELLPSKWSDFEFWGRLFDEKKEEFTALLAASKTEPELSRMLPALTALAAGFVGSLLAVGVLMSIRPESGGGLWVCCAACIVMSFAMSLLPGVGLARDRTLWLMPPLCLASRMAADRLALWARGIANQSTM